MIIAQLWSVMTSFLPAWFSIAILSIISIITILIVIKLIALVLDALPFV